MILAGDIGGTNSRFAIFDVRDGRLLPVAESVFPSRKFKTLDEIAVEFMKMNMAKVEHACFGIAGPIKNGRSETPNLAWVVDSQTLGREIGVKQFRLINDLEANAYGLGELTSADFAVLNPGSDDSAGNAAVIAAGTGLGEAGLYRDGSHFRPFATEGGHTDFAPRDELQVELLRYLRTHFNHISWERVLSGPGLYNVYKFLRDTRRGEVPAWLAGEIQYGDPAAVISKAGLAGDAPICVRTLEIFCQLYGAEAGNLALKLMASGGVYLGGGIAPKLVGKLREPGFMESFTDKGRMKPLLEAFPVRVILNDKTALLGAARCAALDAGLI